MKSLHRGWKRRRERDTPVRTRGLRRLILAVATVTLPLLVYSQVVRLREQAGREACRDHLRQVSIVVYCHLSTTGEYPRGTYLRKNDPPEGRLSWFVRVRHYFDDGPLPTVAGPDGESIPDFTADLDVLTCPANPAGATPGEPRPTQYVGIAGLGTDAQALYTGHRRAGVFGHDRHTRPGDITDGAAQTMMVAETDSDLGPWIAGGAATVRGLDPGR
jgi:hypothetical protein